YINGTAVATNNAITLTPDAFNPAVNYIGKSQWSVDPLFNGQIDDFRIYNYALSAAEVGGIVASIPPPAPGSVSASGGNGSSQILLSWGVASGATSYIVNRSTVSGGPYTTIYTGTATSYTDTSVSAGTTYYYVIVAVNAAGESVGATESSGMANIAMPKVHLRFDETTGSAAADASGNSWNGTLVGGSTHTAGRINNAVSLSGTTNYATLPSGVLAGLGDCTLSVWVKPNSFSSFARIFDFGTATTNYMFLTPQYTATAPNAAKPRFAIRTPSVNPQLIDSSITLTANTWNHIAVTLSGNTATLYINGAVAGTNAAMTLTPSSLGLTTQNYLGKSQFSTDPYLNGSLDEFQIYGRALSASEISALVAPLAAPGGVGVSVGNAQATLTWNAVSGATGYNVKRATVSGGPYTVVGANVPGPNWPDTGVINGTSYFYVVTALNGVAESENSTEVSTTPIGPPPIPANFTAISSNGLVTLTWTASSGATSYNIKRSTTDGGGYLTIDTSASATYTDSTVTNGTTYYYVVTAVGANGESAASAQALATPPAPPAAPTGLTATAGNTTVTLAWNASSGATSYNIKRSDVSGSGYELVGTTSATGYVDSDVVSGTPYYYVISAQSVVGEGADSTQATATPVAAPAAPSGAMASPGNGQSWLVWQAVSGATSYTIKRSTVSGGPYTVIASGLTATTDIDNTVVNGTTYYYVITASGAGGEGAASTQLVVTPNNSPLRAHLRFDQTSGATVTDTTGNGWNGTLVGGSTFTAGKINNAVSLSGSTNYATLPTGVIAGLGDCTFSVWVKPNSFTSFARIFDFGTGTTNYMFLTPQYTTTAPNAAKPRFAIRTPSVGEQFINSSIALTANAWNHIAVTFSGNTATLYINGAVAGTNAAMTLTPSSLGFTTQNYLGKSQFPDPYFNGALDEFQIYNSTLSPSEISAVAAASLNAPTNLVATPGETHAALSWSAVSGVTGYNVKRAYMSGGPYTILGFVTETSYTDTNLAVGSPYYYVVSTVDGILESVNSTEASATTMAPPPAPVDLTATGGDAQVALAWAASPGAASYQIKRSLNSDGPYAIVASGVTGTSLTDTGLTNGTAYYYVVSAVNLGGESANSTEASATPLPPVPSAPSGVTATPGDAQVALAWSATSGAASYNVKRSTVSGGPYTLIASGLTAPNYLDNTVANATTYYYVITAVNVGGEGSASTELGATPNLLRAHLRFDEISGTTATDTSGNGWNGTLVGGSTWTTGKINNAVSLSGTTNYATLPSGVVAGLSDCTLMTWVKLNSFSTWARIFDLGTGTTNYMFLAPQGPTAKRIRFAIRTPLENEQQINSTVNTPVGAWFHVAVTFSGSVGTLYVNGAVAGTNTGMTLTPSSLGLTTRNYLGKSQFNDPYLNGSLDEFQIYGRALSAAEISALAGASLTAPLNLAATPGESQIGLSWSAVSGATGYNVKRAYVSGGPYTILGPVTGTNYTDTSLAVGTPYYYVVSTLKGVVESVNSAEAGAAIYSDLQRWRLNYFGTIESNGNSADMADPDGDGWTNAQEFITGTDPTNAASTLKISELRVSGNDCVVGFPTVSGKAYRVERSDTLEAGSWTIVQGNIAGTGGTVQFTDAGAAGQAKRFYRIVTP
ncbi:MAG: LamG-like jellyroll fold domain-containing protein, partial [Luteolibacter sp.]